MENNKWDFLSAPRFWVMIAGTLSVYAEMKGWIGEPETILVASISAIFIAVKTVDRISDKRIEAAKVESTKETVLWEKQ